MFAYPRISPIDVLKESIGLRSVGSHSTMVKTKRVVPIREQQSLGGVNAKDSVRISSNGVTEFAKHILWSDNCQELFSSFCVGVIFVNIRGIKREERNRKWIRHTK